MQRSLEAVDPEKVLKQSIIRKHHRLFVDKVEYDLSQYERIACVGAGKASGHMAESLERILGTYLESGMIIIKDGTKSTTKKIQIANANHPLPDGRGIRATQKILNIVNSLNINDILIVLLSGGASSLLCAPAQGLTLVDKRRTINMLLRCGASIHELNTVRKHLSNIKGGQLAKATSATLLTLIMSDVMGDDLSTIGSGPTVPDPTTFQEAKSILERYQLWHNVPERIRQHLEQGINGHRPETWKRRSTPSSRCRSFILANIRTAMDGMAKEAKRLGLRPFILDTFLQGEAKDLGAILGVMAKDLREFGNPIGPPACFIAGGEPTVTVKGKGKGGRAQECVLAAAQEISGLKNVLVAGFGTDGTDGPTNAAGAVVDGETVHRGKKKGLSIARSLEKHDSYTFFNTIGGHIITGPTRTNVSDLYLILAL